MKTTLKTDKMLTKQYLQCLKELENNPNIELGKYSQTNYYNCEPPTQRSLERAKSDLLKENYVLSDTDLEIFNLSAIVLNWDSRLSLADVVLRGGFVFNGITDALLFPTDDFKNTRNLHGKEDLSGKLAWIERLPMGVDDSMQGCCIKETGIFPPAMAFCNAGAGWYTQLNMDYYQYLELLFQNYGFKGWQYFYMNIIKEIPNLEEVLDDMRVAVKTLPLLFPDKDWSYHQQRYDEVMENIK